MADKKITLIFLSANNKIKQVKLSKGFIWTCALIFLIVAISLGLVIKDYLRVKTQIIKLTELNQENSLLKSQLVLLSHKIVKINKRIKKLNEFDRKLRMLVNLETDKESTPFIGIGGSDPSALNPDYTIEKAHRKLIRLMHQSIDKLDEQITIQTNEKIELYKFLEKQKSLLAATPSIWPTRGWVSSKFGWRISPFTNQREFHRGLDICAREGNPVIAPADGIVSSVTTTYGYGKMLSINHGYGIKTIYAHLSKILVKKGQHVKRGQKIALVGKTGKTTGPHLHYEVHLNGVAVNPLRYILN